MRYGLERHNETLLRLGERWRGILDDQPTKADAGPRNPHPILGREKTQPDAASSGPLNRIVDTDRDGS